MQAKKHSVRVVTADFLRTWFPVAVTILGFGLSAIPAHASNCADRNLVVERLQSKYQEVLAAGGIQKAATNNAVVEVWASPETGTFTVLLTKANGVTCIMATGTDWHQTTLAASKPETKG